MNGLYVMEGLSQGKSVEIWSRFGDALDDMPDEYKKYVDECIGRDMDISNCLFAGRHGLSATEKPKGVASVLFKYDGGEWLHMAEHIVMTPFGMTLWKHLDTIPLSVGQRGTLTVRILESGQVYQVGAVVSLHHRDDDCSALIAFDMERDEVGYTPDELPVLLGGLYSLNRCPDCDATLEQRSMPDGIEEWCPVCNVQAEVIANAGNWESHDWRIRLRDIDKDPDARWLKCSRCGVNAMQGNTTIESCSFFTNRDREIWEDVEATEAEGPMHPEMIRAELQKAMDEGYSVSVDIKPQFDENVPGVIGKVTEVGSLFMKIGEEPFHINVINSVTRMGVS